MSVLASLCYFWSRDVFHQILLSPRGPVFAGNDYQRCCVDRLPCDPIQTACCAETPGNSSLVLFDFGAFSGESLAKWLDPSRHPENLVSSILTHEGLLARFPENRTHLVAVEPNPEAFESLRQARDFWTSERDFNVTVVEAAVSTSDGRSRLRPPRGEEGFFLRLDENEGVETTTVDAGSLIARHCGDDDVCICAFDVEGAEFEIMRSLFFKQPSLGCLCDVLIVEWHEIINEQEEYLLNNDFEKNIHDLTDIPPRLLSAAVLDSAMRYLLEARDPSCPTVYIGFRYDQAIFDI